MVLRISEIKLRPDHTEKELEREIRRILRAKDEPFTYEIVRQSIDARKKPELFFVYTVGVSIRQPEKLLKKLRSHKAVLTEKREYVFPEIGRASCRERTA